jgi:hypothetical protein
MFHRVALVRTDLSEELIASIISVTRFGKLGTPLAVSNSRSTLRRNTNSWPCQWRRYVLPERRFLKETLRHVPDDGIICSHRHENLRSQHIINRLGSVAET